MKETIRFNSEQATNFVKTALWAMDYPIDTEVTTKVDEEDKVTYQATYRTMYHGELTKSIMPISRRNFIELMTVGMSLKGYTTEHIHFTVRDKKVQYEAVAEIVSYDTLSRKRRKG